MPKSVEDPEPMFIYSWSGEYDPETLARMRRKRLIAKAKKQKTEANELGITINRDARVTENPPTFYKLNCDVRRRIYEYLFEGGVVDFIEMEGFERSGQMLRVSKAIYEETRIILYQQNHFRLGWGHMFDSIYHLSTKFLCKIGRNYRMYPRSCENCLPSLCLSHFT